MLRPLLLAALVASPWAAEAAQADRQRPLIIQGGDGSRVVGEQRQDRVEMQGGVTVTQGSLLLRMSNLLWTRQADGASKVVATSTAGVPVRFSQDTDRPGEAVEGVADQVQYDEATGMVRLLGQAQLRFTAGGQMQREFSGNEIAYDTLKEVVTADGKSGAGRSPDGLRDGSNVRVIIMPKPAASAAQPAAAPAPLRLAPALTPKPPSP